MRSRSHSGWRAWGLGLMTALAMSAAEPAQAWSPPQKQHLPLRLDESPALPLLEPFRHAAGRPQSHLRRYLGGRFGQWHSRSWHTLRLRIDESAVSASPLMSLTVQRALGLRLGDGLLADALAATGLLDDAAADLHEVSARPVWEVSLGQQWLELHGRSPVRWPFVVPDRHWFQPRAVDLAQPVEPVEVEDAGFTISTELLSPWLQKLDDHLARPLLASSGCGRGGPCSTQVSFPANAFEKLWSALSPKEWPIPAWQCKPREATIGRYGSESDTFLLTRCDGSVPPDALDRLSIIARPPGVARPGDVLPDQAHPGGAPGEWLPGIRVMHPRLLWLLQRLAHEWPWHPIYIYSGYRPAPSPPRPHSRNSQHWLGRALDLTVLGVPNEELFQLCRELPDVGCGFYPNKRFVHLDVRPRGFGRVFWIDVAEAGERAEYLDSWPGLVEAGARPWDPPS